MLNFSFDSNSDKFILNSEDEEKLYNLISIRKQEQFEQGNNSNCYCTALYWCFPETMSYLLGNYIYNCFKYSNKEKYPIGSKIIDFYWKYC